MRLAVTALIALGISGCGFSDESKIQDAVRARLKDPDSARFGELTVVGKQACITVNAKNSMGGYTGDQQAYLQEADGNWDVVDISSKLNHAACLQVIAGVKY